MTYVLIETELDSVAAFNSRALLGSSLGMFFLSLGINIWVADAFTIGEVSAVGKLLVDLAKYVCFPLSFFSFLFMGWEIKSKTGLLNKIKKETQVQN